MIFTKGERTATALNPLYPWKSARVLSTLLVGFFVLVAFALWEIFADFKEPLLPVHLFKNFSWVAACVLLGLGASLVFPLTLTSAALANKFDF